MTRKGKSKNMIKALNKARNPVIRDIVNKLSQDGFILRVFSGNLKIISKTGKSLTAEQKEILKNNKEKIVYYLKSKQINYKKNIAPFQLLSKQDKTNLEKQNNIEDAYPASTLQKGILFHSEYSTEAPIYLEISSFIIQTNFNEQVFKRILLHFVTIHPILRTSFDVSKNSSELIQLVYKNIEIPIKIIDISQTPPRQHKKIFLEWITSEKKAPFNWQHPPLFRIKIHVINKNSFHFGITFHHAILDGWSFNAFNTELWRMYNLLNNGKLLPSVNAIASYNSFIKTEKNATQNKAFQMFWKKELNGFNFTKVLAWPSDKLNEKIQHHVKIKIPSKSYTNLQNFSQKQELPLDVIFLAVHLRVLAMLSGNNDITTGVVFNLRPETEDGDQILGLFLNSLPFRQNIANLSWIKLIKTVLNKKNGLYPYRFYPLAKIQQDISSTKIFDTLFSFTNFNSYHKSTADSKEINSLKIKPLPGYAKTNFPIVFNVDTNIVNHNIICSLICDGSIFCKKQVASFGKYYENAVSNLLRDINSVPTNIQLMPKEEYNKIVYEWNKTDAPYPKDKTTNQLFEEQVEKTPNNVAVVFEKQSSTYHQLNEKANQLARYIRETYRQETQKDLKPDTLITLCLDRSIDMIIAIFAILKAGGAYVPIDSNYPDERIKYILEDTKTKIVITQSHLQKKLNNIIGTDKQITLIPINENQTQKKIAEFSTKNLPQISHSKDLAYVIYTSGTTGQPKGVMIEHKNILNYLTYIKNEIFKQSLKICFPTNIMFDFSVTSTLGTLLTGKNLVIYNKALTNLHSFIMFIHHNNIDTIKLIPSYAEQIFLDYKSYSLKTLIIGGEKLNNTQINLFKKTKINFLFNEYGPTETTVGSIISNVLKSKNAMIGKPILNTKIYVLKPDLTSTPIGTIGELHIGGAGLARGYLNQPELTAEKFIPNPFATEMDRANSYTRVYKTGDLVRWLPDGNMEFIGRNDNQIKIRGFRVELEEIESALITHPLISRCIVKAPDLTQNKLDHSTNKHLVAYYTTITNKEIKENDLRTYLVKKLPHYMIPSFFIKLRKIPLNANGKFDRTFQLPIPNIKSIISQNYVPPRNEIEKKLCDIWCDVLELDKVGIHDNFFSIGGNSISAVTIASKLKKIGLNVNPCSFNMLTIAEMAEKLDHRLETTD